MSVQRVSSVKQSLNYPVFKKVSKPCGAAENAEKGSGEIKNSPCTFGRSWIGYDRIYRVFNRKPVKAAEGAGNAVKETITEVVQKTKDFIAEHTASFKQDFETAATVIADLNGRKVLEKKDFEVIQEISKLPSFNGANVNAENWVAGNLKIKEAVVGLLARLKGCFKEDEKIASALSKAKSDLADYAIYQISGEGRAQTREECQKAISIVAKYPEEAKKARPRFSLSGIVSSNANQHDIRVSEYDMSKLESIDEVWL